MFEIIYASNKSFLNDLFETDPVKLLKQYKKFNSPLCLEVVLKFDFLPWENLVQV